MRKIITRAEVVTKGKNGKPRYLEWCGKKIFSRELLPGETIIECIDHGFEMYGLDTTDIPKSLKELEDDGETLIIKYYLEVDPLSLLEFLISEEGKISGLSLTTEEN